MKAFKYFPIIKRQYYKVINFYNMKINNVIFQRNNINGIIYIKNNGGRLKIGNNFSANSGVHANPIGGDSLIIFIVYKKDA